MGGFVGDSRVGFAVTEVLGDQVLKWGQLAGQDSNLQVALRSN